MRGTQPVHVLAATNELILKKKKNPKTSPLRYLLKQEECIISTVGSGTLGRNKIQNEAVYPLYSCLAETRHYFFPCLRLCALTGLST